MTDQKTVNNIKEGRLVITPSGAKAILEQANYARQRKAYPHHVTLLADAMRRGNWTPGSQIAFARYGGRLHLVNGQHRMHAVIESGRGIEFQVLIENVDSPADIDALYYRFDVTQRQRSLSEVLNATEVAELHGLSKAVAKGTYEAVAFITNNLYRPYYQADPVRSRSVDARLEAAEPWWNVAAKYEAAIGPAPKTIKGKLTNAGVMAVGLVTMRHQPEIAREFWGGVAENDGLRKGDPRSTYLRDLLFRHQAMGAHLQGVVASCVAWNAYFSGRTLKIIKVLDSSVPKVLGTPFDGVKP